MSTALVSINQSIADEYVRRYQTCTKNALENILSMGEAVYEIYQKSQTDELSQSDLDYFCKTVHLDMKSSTFRKYKAIGENSSRFREYMEKLPPTFSVLYEMATLSGDDFERFVKKCQFSKNITLEEFKKIVKKSSVLTKNKIYQPHTRQVTQVGMAKLIQEINQFKISILRGLSEESFHEVLESLTIFKNKGWIQFDYPIITEYGPID